VRQPGSSPETARRKTGFGPGEWLLLALPILSGLRLRFVGPGSDVVAADMLVDMAGPGLAMLAFAVGAGGRLALPRDCRDDVHAMRKASTLRFLAIVVAAGIGLWIVFPVDLVTQGGAWRRMILWALGVALPLWGAGLFALVRGRHTLVAAMASLLLGAAPSALALGFGLLYGLRAPALVMPATAAGLVAGGGAVLAAWFGVTARGWRVLIALIVLAAGPTWAVSHHHGSPPLDTLSVYAIQGLDVVNDRIVLWTERPDTHTQRMVEVALDTGLPTPLHPLTRGVVYAAGTRVAWRRHPLGHSTNWSFPKALCRETGDESVCRRGVLPDSGYPILTAHPRRPLVLATLIDRILVWDLEADRFEHAIFHGKRIRWPCFSGEHSILYRTETPSGPFQHMSLDLRTMASTPLGDGHDLQCEPDVPVVPHAQFRRGTKRLGIPGRVFAEGLSEGGVELAGTVVYAVWSRDGSTLAMMFEGRRRNLGAYDAEDGFYDRLTIPASPDLALSPRDSLLAHASHDEVLKQWTVHVTELATGTARAELLTDGPDFAWSADGRLFVLQDLALVAVDPASGAREVVFPRPEG